MRTDSRPVPFVGETSLTSATAMLSIFYRLLFSLTKRTKKGSSQQSEASKKNEENKETPRAKKK